jgi:hypothetical protein
MASKRTPIQVRFVHIEREFELVSYRWFDGAWCPAVKREDDGTYRIRVLMSRTVRGANTTDKYDYFEIDADGIVTKAPRGYTSDFKGCQVTGLGDAAAKYGVEDPAVLPMAL